MPVWSGAVHEETGLQQNGTRLSLVTNPDSISALHTSPTADVMVWGAIAYNTRSPLALIQWYVHDILQTYVLPLMQWLPEAIFQQGNA
ncbi:uncharacterized protein TNCV_3619611 [Trichonephila clavipes]|nr:uncharacterized protein TNCV_3619611 [Trichonephila clavipes]